MVVQRPPSARYDRIAAILASNMRLTRRNGASCETVERIAHDLADIYRMSDPGFSRTRFLRRAGVGL